VKIFETADIRNVVLAGHSGCGKTTLAEAMLFAAGAISRQGRVAEGSSTLDFVPEEQKRHTGIFLSLAQFEYEGKKFNLLDCPGYADFIGEVYAGISAADSGVVVVSSTAGVEPETERVFQLMGDRSMPRFFAISGMDKEQADFNKVLTQIREVISERVVPLYYPIGAGADFSGIVDVMAGKAYTFGSGKEVTEVPVPNESKAMIDEARGKLVELAAESDDAYLEKYLETLELSPEETLIGLRKGIAQGKIYPVLPVSGERNRGVKALLDMLSSLAPSPLEVAGESVRKHGVDEPIRLPAKPEGPLAAHIFKISSEIMAQETALIRVYSGTLTSGSDVYDSSHDTGERVGQLYHFMGKERSDAERLVAGDIGAAAKLKSAGLNDTLTTKDQKLVVIPIEFPRPVHEMGVRSKKQGDEEKVGTAFGKLKDEDPTFQIEVQSDLHQTVLRSMGDQHVDVIVERLRRKFAVDVETFKPRIPYRETIKGTSDVAYRHKKQTGGRGQFADVSIKLEPMPRSGGFEFEDEIVGGVIPSKFIPAVEKGVVEAMSEGVVAGYPVVDVRVRLHFGSYHDVDSSEMAFKIAGLGAFRKGVQEAKPILLEPVMQVTIDVPEDYTGGVMGDLSSRRGKILGMEPGNKSQRIKATVPAGELYRYSTTLRTLTQGRARYQSEFSHYEEVPREFADKLIEELKKEKEATA
jgi:elongation factor G